MQGIEARGRVLSDCGAIAEWFSQADIRVRTVACDVNGPLLEELARSVNYHDLECVEHFRLGAPLYGRLPAAGNGLPREAVSYESAVTLRSSCSERNH